MRRSFLLRLLPALLCLSPAVLVADERTRIRDLGVSPGVLTPGPLNAITDVGGVLVGHQTIVRGENVRTGVTAIFPHGGNVFQEKVPAAVYTANGFGKAAGFLQVEELGNLEVPIVLTNTLSVGTAIETVVAWTLEQEGNEDVRSVNAVVGETNDGRLNDIRGRHVKPEDVRAALAAASGGPVEEGSVGAGTGTMSFGFKAGVGTSSRRLPEELGGWTVGVLVQSNFGGLLTIDGVRVGEALGKVPGFVRRADQARGEEGSCMIVIAVDAPLSARNLERLAKRAQLGLARTGSYLSNGSGDFIIAFSTQNKIDYGARGVRTTEELSNNSMNGLFLAVVEAVEEAVYNSLTRATSVRSASGEAEALPIDELRSLLAGRSQP